MRYFKLKNCGETTIRVVYNDDKTIRHGMMGMVKDFCKAGIYEWCSYRPDGWTYIPDGDPNSAIFRLTKEMLKEEIENIYK